MLLPALLLLTAAESCPTPAVPLTGPLAAWNKPHDLTRFPGGATYAVIEPGQRFDLALAAGPIRFWLPPAKTPATETRAAIFGVTIKRAGTYRIALSTAAWLDIIRDDKFLASTAHAHGPACSGIRKMVDFKLAPGTYAAQISGSADAKAGVLVTLLP